MGGLGIVYVAGRGNVIQSCDFSDVNIRTSNFTPSILPPCPLTVATAFFCHAVPVTAALQPQPQPQCQHHNDNDNTYEWIMAWDKQGFETQRLEPSGTIFPNFFF